MSRYEMADATDLGEILVVDDVCVQAGVTVYCLLVLEGVLMVWRW